MPEAFIDMAKKKPIPKNQKKNTSWLKNVLEKFKKFARNHRIISTILVIVLAGSLVWLGRVTVERYQFHQAEKRLNSLATDVQTALGSEKKLEKERSCVYSSAKFSKGDLSCSIRFYVKFSHTNPGAATRLTDKVKQVVENDKNFSFKQTSNNDLPFLEYANEEGSEDQFISIKMSRNDQEPICLVSSTYHAYGTKNKKNLGASDSLIISLSCFGSAKLEYFPVKPI